MKETIPSSSITWSEMGKQNIQAKEVYCIEWSTRLGKSTKNCVIKLTVTSKLLKHLIILMLLFNLRVILDLNELTSRGVNNIFQKLGPDLLMKFLQLLTIISSSYINNINVNNKKFGFSWINCSIVFLHLNKLCRSKATGLDNISGC